MKTTTIKEFLKIKETQEYKKNKEGKWKKYPIEFQNEEGYLEIGYIQDVREVYSEESHELIVSLLMEDFTGFIFRKSCKAPKGCKVDWDKVHCAYKIILFDAELFGNED